MTEATDNFPKPTNIICARSWLGIVNQFSYTSSQAEELLKRYTWLFFRRVKEKHRLEGGGGGKKIRDELGDIFLTDSVKLATVNFSFRLTADS